MKVAKRIIAMILSVSLLAPNMTTMVSFAQESSYSISSPEEFVPNSGVDVKSRRQLFNDDWKFILGDQGNAHLTNYNDSSWKTIDLPHDYSLIQNYTKSGEAESGYKLGGIGWYRKSFRLDGASKDKRVVIEFGGVYMNATVYINGHKLGDHPYGYTPFAYDLSKYINFDGENVIAVKVDHKFPSSRWYSGSGIYRNVHLTVTDKIYVDHYGVKIQTPNLEKEQNSTVGVLVESLIKNDSDKSANVVVKQGIRLKGSQEILAEVTGSSVSIDGNSSKNIGVSLSVSNPKLWSIKAPNLYEVVTTVMSDGAKVDEYVTDYGFRYIKHDAKTGFYLNGKHTKLKGVSMHHDQGSLGARAYEDAIARQIDILKKMGVNAIRVTHNPAADELIDLANKKGMLVIDEAFDTWVKSKNGNGNDYAGWYRKTVGENPLLGSAPDMTWAEMDIKTMVKRGINSPAIIAWSTGNEVMEGNAGPYGEYPGLAKQLSQWINEVDTTRPPTIGDNKLKALNPTAISIAKNIDGEGGTVGLNYASEGNFDRYHRDNPSWKIYASETSSAINSRGVYKNGIPKQLTSYDESTVGWGHVSSHSWSMVAPRDFVAGEFVWTGFDYLGEPTPYNKIGPGAQGDWPSPKSSYFGIVDTAGLPKDRYYFYQSQWNDDVNTLHILPAWKEGMVDKDIRGNVRVDVYSDAKKVELLFTGKDGVEKSLGKKEFTKHTTEAGFTYQKYEGADKNPVDHKNYYLTWKVPFAEGKLRGVAYDENDKVIENTQGRKEVSSFGTATTMALKANRTQAVANGKDLTYVTIDILDKDGKEVADATNLVKASVTGNGRLVAMDNGEQADHEPYDSGKRKAFSGKLIAIVQSTKDAGEFTLSVSSEGLESKSITVKTTPDQNASTERRVVGYTLSKNYYVKLGNQPNLAKEIKVRFSDGKEENHGVTWDVNPEQFNKVGIYSIKGTIADTKTNIGVNVTVIENVGALLNYSTAVDKGIQKVHLPNTRPLVVETGEVLNTEFPVKWEEQSPGMFEKEGIVVIKGNANVFGETLPVTASIRVASSTIKPGDNVSPNNLTLTQSIPENLQSDNLKAIVDGNKGFRTVVSGPNNSIWSNYDNAQTGDNKADIVFTYATAQNLGKIVLHFYQDSWSARLPEEVKLYWSNTGTQDAVWTEIPAKVTKGETSPSGYPNVTPITYEFEPVSAVGLKISLKSQIGDNGHGKKLAMGMTEAELFTVTSSLEINGKATIDELKINNEAVSNSSLESKNINTEFQKAKIDPISNSNAAITILPPYENTIRIITESENHEKRETYRINLGKKGEELPSDDGRDYPPEKTTATASDFQSNNSREGNPKFAVDKNNGTIFHTLWANKTPKEHWLKLELEDVTKLDGLRYLSRSGGSNGIVENYKIEVSTDDSNWKQVSTGTWTDDGGKWSVANFDFPVEAKYVRLTALSTYGEGNQQGYYMSAAEVRVRKAKDISELQDSWVTLEKESYDHTGKPIKPTVVVKDGDKVLEEGIDYSLEYKDNTDIGQGKVIVKGIVKYSGEIEKPFIIAKAKVITEKLTEKINESEKLDLTKYTDDSVKAVTESLNKAKAVIANEDKTQQQVDEALKNLEDAIHNLKEKPIEPIKKVVIGFKSGENGSIKQGETSEFTIDSGKTWKESGIKIPEVVADNGYVFDKWSPTMPKDDDIITTDMEFTALFKSKSENPTPKPEPIPTPDPVKGKLDVSMIAGATRYETAIEISKIMYPKGSDNVVLASGENYPDALAASVLASGLDAPLLLTPAGELEGTVKEEIQRLGAKNIRIIGGGTTITKDVESQLSKLGVNVDRIAGSDRYATAIKIAREVAKQSGISTKIILASGTNYADALSIAPYAGVERIGILLAGKVLDKNTQNALEGIKDITIVGGTNSVSKEIEKYLRDKGIKVSRIAGESRYDTSYEIGKKFFPNSKQGIIASGENYPDALSGSVMAIKEKSPIMLVQKNNVISDIMDDLKKNDMNKLFVLGGRNTISKEVVQGFKSIEK